MIEAAGRADAVAFLVRLLRLQPTALARLRPIAPDRSTVDPAGQDSGGRVEMWAMLPFEVLVVRVLATRWDTDVTVEAAALLATLRDDAAPKPSRRDAAWRWPLPPSAGVAVEQVPVAEVFRVAAAASRTLRTAVTQGVGGRAVGERVVRDALLDHIPIVVTGPEGDRVDVPQRLVQAVVRLGLAGQVSPDLPTSVTLGANLVTVRHVAGWIGLECLYGSAWYRPTLLKWMS